MTRIKTLTTCGDGHRQELTFEGVSREWVESWCGLIDGTSPMYLHKPCDDPKSVIGKCCWPVDDAVDQYDAPRYRPCGKQIHAEIIEESNGSEVSK